MDSEKDRLKESIYTTAPWYIESNVGSLTIEDQAFLRNNSVILQYKPNEIIYSEGKIITELCYINKGVVRYDLNNSAGEIKTVFFTDRFLSLECFLHGQFALTNAIAVDEVEIFALPAELADDAFSRASIRNLALKALSIKCRILGWQVNDLSLCKPLEKICRLLCCYITSDQGRYKIHLSHQELANLSGLHRVTVSNNISQLRRMKIIDSDKNGLIVVLDLEKLKEIGFDNRM